MLESERTLPLADLEILCFKRDFKRDLARWKSNWEGEKKTALDSKANGVAIGAAMKQIHTTIADYEGLALTRVPSADYGLKIRRRMRMIANDAIDQVNRDIIVDKIQARTLSTELGELVFAVDSRGLDKRDGISIRLSSGETIWLYNVPIELQSTPARWNLGMAYEDHSRMNQLLELMPQFMAGDVATVKDLLLGWIKDLRKLEASIPASYRDECLAKAMDGCRIRFFELLERNAFSSVRTDSKGNFSIPGSSGFLYAQHQRPNGEALTWFLRIDREPSSVRLSNSTVTALENTNTFWMFHPTSLPEL